MHFEHFAEAGGELRERALQFFFAKLAEDALQLGLGLLQFLDRLLLTLGRAFALGFFELLQRLLHLLLGFLQPIGRAIGRVLRLLRLLVRLRFHQSATGEPGWPGVGGDCDGFDLLGLPG